MPIEDDAFLLRARKQDRLTAEPASFGLAMMELVATDSVPLSGGDFCDSEATIGKSSAALPGGRRARCWIACLAGRRRRDASPRHFSVVPGVISCVRARNSGKVRHGSS